MKQHESNYVVLINKIYKRLKDTAFCLYGKYRFWRGLPGMTGKEIDILKKILLAYGEKKLRVLEWGCGKSTIYYTKYLRSLEIDCEWYGIDNSREWFEWVRGRVDQAGLEERVHLYLFEFTPFWLKPEWDWNNPGVCGFGPKEENELDYIYFPKKLNLKFDLIIVDARFRRRCLIEAQKLLAPQGLVILHDAQKVHYHSPLTSYKYGQFVDSGYLYGDQNRIRAKMWIGSNDRQDLMVKA